jgi:hypothetical protein
MVDLATSGQAIVGSKGKGNAINSKLRRLRNALASRAFGLRAMRASFATSRSIAP